MHGWPRREKPNGLDAALRGKPGGALDVAGKQSAITGNAFMLEKIGSPGAKGRTFFVWNSI
jgi:hypothetical protein